MASDGRSAANLWDDLTEDIEFVKRLGKFAFIETRIADGYRRLAVVPGATRDEARQAVLDALEGGWEVRDA